MDANIVIYCVVESAHSSDARRAAQLDPKWILPPLWRYEVTSALLKLVRGHAITIDQAVAAIGDASGLVAGREVPVDQARALITAMKLRISAYDAQYVNLAIEYGIKCVTADGPLAAKARDIAVSLSEFVK